MGKKSDEKGGKATPGMSIAIGAAAVAVLAVVAGLRHFGLL